MLSWINTGIERSLPAHCEPQSDLLSFVSATFKTCIPTNLALLSSLLGCMSIVAWLFAQLPQIYKNYKLKSTAGLSIYFLIEWCLGDTTNLAGAVVTYQATWQITIAAYYTIVDFILVCQFYYFMHYRKKVEVRISSSETPPRPGSLNQPEPSSRAAARPVNRPRGPLNDFRFPGSISPLGLEKTTPGSSRLLRQPAGPSPLASPKTVLMISMILALISRTQASPLPSDLVKVQATSVREVIGQLLSWSSTSLYLGSRFPQLYKNWKRQSTSGLSISLFIAAFFGNLFYSASMVANPLAWGSYPAYGLYGWVGPDGSDRSVWIRLAAPFFLGAAGVLSLDAAMAFQFWMYGEGKRGAKMIVVADENGQKHWERVNGWMRGFIPSPSLSPLRFVEDEDSRSLLGSTPPASASNRRNYGSVQTPR